VEEQYVTDTLTFLRLISISDVIDFVSGPEGHWILTT